MNHEHAVLGAAIIAPEYVPIICGELETSEFTTIPAMCVFEVICELWKAGAPIDLVTVTNALEQHDKLESVGGTEFLIDLISFTPTAANTRSYIEMIHETTRRRVFSAGIRRTVQDAETGEDGYLETARSIIDEVARIGGADVVMIGDILPAVINRIGDTFSGRLSGFSTLDRICGGFGDGNLVVVAARPGVGKTALACNIAANMCKANMVTAYFSLEMETVEIAERIILSESMKSKVSARRDKSAQDAVFETQDVMNGWKMFIDDRGSISTGQIVSSCYKFKQKAGKLDAVFVDYIQLIHTSGNKNSTRDQRLGEVSRALKILAKEMKCPVIALSQLNRNAEGREPTIADLRESGAIEQDADVVLLLHREKENDKTVSLIVGKNRHGNTGKIDLVWNGEITRFFDPTFKDVNVPKGVLGK